MLFVPILCWIWGTAILYTFTCNMPVLCLKSEAKRTKVFVPPVTDFLSSLILVRPSNVQWHATFMNDTRWGYSKYLLLFSLLWWGEGGGHCVEPLMPPTSPHLPTKKKGKISRTVLQRTVWNQTFTGWVETCRTYWFCDLKKGLVWF